MVFFHKTYVMCTYKAAAGCIVFIVSVIYKHEHSVIYKHYINMNILSYTNIYKHEHMFFATFDIMLEGKCISYYAEQNKKSCY